MLILEANIHFYTEDESQHCLPFDLKTKNILRPAINLGGYLSSGTIITDKNIDILIRGQNYHVFIEMPLIFGDAYEAVKSALINGYIFEIKDGIKVVGNGQILNFDYKEEGQGK